LLLLLGSRGLLGDGDWFSLLLRVPVRAIDGVMVMELVRELLIVLGLLLLLSLILRRIATIALRFVGVSRSVLCRRISSDIFALSDLSGSFWRDHFLPVGVGRGKISRGFRWPHTSRARSAER
jgi:hypothetical protein